LIISRSVPLQRKIFHTNFVQKIKTQTLCSVTFYESRAVYEKRWKHTVQSGRPQMTIYGACALHYGYVSLQNILRACNTLFSLQKLLHERTSMLRSMYTTSVV